MLGFGTIFCVLGEHQVSKRQARRVTGRRNIAVSSGCREQWQRSGATCGRCETRVLGEPDLGIFLDRYALAHLDRGAVRLDGAPNGRIWVDAASSKLGASSATAGVGAAQSAAREPREEGERA
jgi:hypothetical protein